ncbi:MAG: flippase [Rikenellaceae bacterium]|nr:flippase [Rikenellaceae bacterium]
MGLINKVSKITKNGDARVLASNFVWLSALQVAGYLFPLITLPYLARVIGADGFGKVAFASAIMVWIQTIADWGFNLTATRDVAKNRDDAQKVSEIFSNVLWARCLLAVVSLAVLIGLILLVPKFYENRLVILVTYLMIPGHILFPDWFFQAVEKMKYITILNVLLKLLFTIAVFVFVKDREDYILQPLFTSIGYVFCGVLSLYLIIGKWGVKLQKPSIARIITTIKDSTNVFINNLAPNLYNSLSIVLLGIFGGSGATGIFDGGNKFISLCQQFMTVISRVFFPYLSRQSNRHKILVVINMTVAIVFALLLFVLAPYIVRLMLSAEFAESVYVIRILAISVIFLALSDSYGTNYLIIHKRDRELRNITIIGSIFGLCIGVPLIYYYGYTGAAVTITTARVVLGVLTYVVAKREKYVETN